MSTDLNILSKMEMAKTIKTDLSFLILVIIVWLRSFFNYNLDEVEDRNFVEYSTKKEF